MTETKKAVSAGTENGLQNSALPRATDTIIQHKPDFVTLSQYIKSGITLFMFTHNYCDMTGKPCKLPAAAVTTEEQLQAAITAGRRRFVFLPHDYNLLCFDIDEGHGDGSGIAAFKELIAPAAGWTKDSVKTVVSTPRGGLHFYFSIPADWKVPHKVTLPHNVEIHGLEPAEGKYPDNLTAAGSARTDGTYDFIKGNLSTVSILPCLLREYIESAAEYALLKAVPRLQEEQNKAVVKSENKYGAADNQWTIERCTEYAEKTGEFMNRRFYRLAYAMRIAGYSKDDALNAVTAYEKAKSKHHDHPADELQQAVSQAYNLVLNRQHTHATRWSIEQCVSAGEGRGKNITWQIRYIAMYCTRSGHKEPEMLQALEAWTNAKGYAFNQNELQAIIEGGNK